MATTMATVPSSPSPQPTRARRASYRVLMNRLCSIAGLLAVVAEEDLLQIQLRAGQGEQPVAGGRLDQGVDLPLDDAGHHRPLDPQGAHTRERAEVGGGTGSAKRNSRWRPARALRVSMSSTVTRRPAR